MKAFLLENVSRIYKSELILVPIILLLYIIYIFVNTPEKSGSTSHTCPYMEETGDILILGTVIFLASGLINLRDLFYFGLA